MDLSLIEAWEAGTSPVALTKLENMADYFKRPVAAFLLPRPPQTPPPPPDFRSLPERQGVFSKETWLALRRARRLQAVAADLMQALEQPGLSDVGITSPDADSEEIAARERARFGVSVSTQGDWRDSTEALAAWRDLLERHTILTFQLKMPVEDTRGFSLAEHDPFVIAISSDDSMNARMFTLFHEYGHLMMRSSGICLPREGEPSGQPERMERWCDHFAGAFLMPREPLRHDSDCKLFLDGALGSEKRLTRLSRRYKVSRLALLTRLLMLGWLSRERYAREVGGLGVPQPTRGGPVEYASRIVREKGRTFTSLVLQAHEQNVVGYSEVADYLGIRLKHLERIRELLSV